jgi:methionyl-tRNA synthetase
MSKIIYLTTPLYYVNAAPHIGHSYTEIAADALARYHRLAGREVFLLTGTDEHGQKIAQAAAAAGKAPQEFVDGVVSQFEQLWKTLNIRYDDFIRTTQPRHITAVQAMLTKLHDEGKLKRAAYQGWYCTPDETFWTETEVAPAPAGASSPLCPSCQRPLERTTEEGWYLELRAAQPWLKAFVSDHPAFVRPEGRYNELKSLLDQPLPEYLCITRPKQRVNWGIEVPFSREHVVYVWVDALFNYITAPGFVEAPARFSRLWPADLHVIGKDILRHHALYWPILLHALGFPDAWMPKMIFAHGWWKVGEQKMSKSLGNIVDPTVVVTQLLAGQPFAADIYRYFLLREVPFGQDGAFSEDALFGRLNADLANDLGNLVNRTLSMIERYCQARIPRADSAGPGGASPEDAPLQRAAVQLAGRLDTAMARVEFSAALDAIMQVVSQANRYVEAAAPWKLAKEEGKRARLHAVLYVLADVVRIIAIALEPFMPSVSSEIWQQLGCGSAPRRLQDASQWGLIDAGQVIGKAAVLFPKHQPAGPSS